MNPKLTAILLDNPFASFYIDRHHKVFRCDGSRPRQIDIKECDLLLAIPESARAMTLVRGGKSIRLATTRSIDVTALHNAMCIDRSDSITIVGGDIKCQIVSIYGHTHALTTESALGLLKHRPMYGVKYIVSKRDVAKYIIRQCYGIEL